MTTAFEYPLPPPTRRDVTSTRLGRVARRLTGACEKVSDPRSAAQPVPLHVQSPVGRPNARLRRTRRRGLVATRACGALKQRDLRVKRCESRERRRAAETSIRPTSASRPRAALHCGAPPGAARFVVIIEIIVMSGALHRRRASAVPTAAALLHARGRRRRCVHRHGENPRCS